MTAEQRLEMYDELTNVRAKLSQHIAQAATITANYEARIAYLEGELGIMQAAQ